LITYPTYRSSFLSPNIQPTDLERLLERQTQTSAIDTIALRINGEWREFGSSAISNHSTTLSAFLRNAWLHRLED
jgi:hypothetical protein